MPRKESQVHHGQELTWQVPGVIFGGFVSVKSVRPVSTLNSNSCFKGIDYKSTDVSRRRIRELVRSVATANEQTEVAEKFECKGPNDFQSVMIMKTKVN